MRSALALALALAACHAKAAPRNPADDGVLVVTSNVRDAQLFVDGHFIAPLIALGGGIAVVPGAHRLELRREDYFSTFLEVEVGKGERKRVALPLAAILP